MLKRTFVVTAALLVLAASASAQTVINHPDADWYISGTGPHETVADTTVPGGKATRVETTGTGGPWEVGALSGIDPAIAKGDHIVAKVWIKADVATQVNLRVEMRGEPWTALGETSVSVGPNWEEKILDFVAKDAYPAGSTQATLHLNTGKQTLWLGPITVTKP